jgi:hypothetical protein
MWIGQHRDWSACSGVLESCQCEEHQELDMVQCKKGVQVDMVVLLEDKALLLLLDRLSRWRCVKMH